jgi:hypothetical protein
LPSPPDTIPLWRLAAFAAVIAVALSGCASFEYETVVTKPKTSALRAIHGANFPVYWLGKTADGERLGNAEMSSGAATFDYGPERRVWEEYRGYPIWISTYAHRKVGKGRRYNWARPLRGGKICTDHVGLALAVWECGNDSFYAVYTGELEIGISNDDGSAGEVADEMSVFGTPASHPGQLPPPKPFSCREAAFMRPKVVREVLLREVPSEPCPGGRTPRRPSRFAGALKGLKPLLSD